MIKQKSSFDQLPIEIRPAFQELGVLKHLRQAGFRKAFGYSGSQLFQLVHPAVSPEELVSFIGKHEV